MESSSIFLLFIKKLFLLKLFLYIKNTIYIYSIFEIKLVYAIQHIKCIKINMYKTL